MGPPGRKGVSRAPFRRPVRSCQHPDARRHRGQRGPAARRTAADAEPLAVRLARLGQGQRGRHRVGDVHDPPLAAQPLPVGPAVPARPAVVHVNDADAAAGEEGLLQVQPRDDLRSRTAVHPDDVRRPLTLRTPERRVGRRVDDRVHDRTRRPGQPGRPRHRQVSRIRQRAGAAAQLADPRVPAPCASGGDETLIPRGGDLDADHDRRHGRPARDGGDGLARRRHAGDEYLVGQVQVGQAAAVRVEHAQPGLAGAVDDGQAAVAEHRVRAQAKLPQRAGELLLPRAQRPGERQQVSQVEVPPSGPIGDHVQAAVVSPDRGQHRLGVAPHDQLLLALVADRPAAIERRDSQFGAVPRHLGVIPADPGQPGTVG